MEIRPATFEDVDAVRDLMVRSMAALGPGFYTPEQTAAAAKYLTVPDSELIEDGTLYVAVARETPSTWEATPKDFYSTVFASPPSADPPSVFHAGARSHPSARAPAPETPSPTVPPSARASLQGEPSSEVLAAVGGWSSRRKLFTGSEDQEGLVGRLDPERDSARIRAFFVDPAFARRGIARNLYEACEASARGAGFRSFSLMATLPGVPLYRALGFGEERPTLVSLPDGTGLPCVEMRRQL